MGNPYDSQSASGYNATPPADDGTETEANRTKWATVKTKLADPLKTFADAINSAVSTAFGKIAYNDVNSQGTNYTVTAADQGKVIRATAAVTITTPEAATVGQPFMFAVKNAHSASITVDGNGSETIDGSATFSLPAGQSVTLMTDGSNWFTATTVPVTVVRKTADEIVQSSTTLQDDDDLAFTLAANEVVFFRLYLKVLSTTAAGFKVAFTVPSGATLSWGGLPLTKTGTRAHTADEDTSGASHGFTGFSSGAGSTELFELSGFVANGANAGNLQLQWAQLTSDVAQTTVHENSHMIVWRG